jgi:hypothetical protein
MFRHASAPAASNSGTATDATTLPNPSNISSESFFYRLLIVRNKTAQIFSTFKFAYFTCKEMPRTCIRIFRYKSLACVTINTFSFQKFFGFVCQTGNTNILLSLILVLHFAGVLPARCASVSNPVLVINQLHAQNLFL